MMFRKYFERRPRLPAGGTASAFTELRNELLTTWCAVRSSGAGRDGGWASRGVAEREARAALGAAVLRLPAVASQRRRLSAAVARQAERICGNQATGTATDQNVFV